ncbi:aminoacyl-tRNA deacylase [Amnibacterium kyonggiense]|uniref:Cys-tRNA(Pro) deacylase n=1 Tax=Amnibacterium kyonggiense TaxID=595671 RepID=A0A4R7FMB7_9MICO|nr:YbaK/EbsC family protein [Amnibacterium kyonggiense]TDS77597.1 Cys-tRNA(Pro) deacylase [Amnibacterium kyonggiense]
MGSERVTEAAERLGLDVELVERPAADSLEGAAALLGLDPASIVKSLVVARSHGTFLFALVPGDRQIAWAKLRAAVGVNKLRLPSADEALAATGYERGTITPLGSSTAWPVFADERITGRIAMGAGAHGFSAFVDGPALLTALDARVADISS